MTCGWLEDSNRWSDARLRERDGTHALAGGAGVPCASLFHGDRDGFFEGVSVVGAMGERPVGLKHHDQGFFEVAFGLGQRPALGVDPGNHLDVAGVPLAMLQIDGGELSNHGNVSVPERASDVNRSRQLLEVR